MVELPGPEAAVLVQAGYAVRTGTVQDERMERPDTRGHYKRGVTGEK